MNTKHLVTFILTAGIAANVSAAPNKPPPEPQDVNVVNTPTVTVTNPQTSVTVDNTTPIPVDVQGGITARTERVFVGFSDITLDGGAGWPAINAACSSKFGNGARMCTGDEVYFNGPLTPPLAPARVLSFISTGTSSNGKWLGAPCSAFTNAANTNVNQVGYALDSNDGQMKYVCTKVPNAFNCPTINQTIVPSVAGTCADLRPVACCQ